MYYLECKPLMLFVRFSIIAMGAKSGPSSIPEKDSYQNRERLKRYTYAKALIKCRILQLLGLGLGKS